MARGVGRVELERPLEVLDGRPQVHVPVEEDVAGLQEDVLVERVRRDGLLGKAHGVAEPPVD